LAALAAKSRCGTVGVTPDAVSAMPEAEYGAGLGLRSCL
jgi:hypothetical protein